MDREADVSFVARNHPQQTKRRGSIAHVDNRSTPPELYQECAELAGVTFDLDVAASDDNTKCGRWLTEDDDGLSREWWGNVWCNPPYSDIRPWVEKAIAERWAGRAELVALLLPANRTEQGWWQDLIEPKQRKGQVELFFLRGRRRFDRPGWTKPKKGDRPPFGLVLVVL